MYHVYLHYHILTIHQLVTLPDSLIVVDYAIGHTGSVHDSLAFRSTRVFKEHEQILAPGEWIWAVLRSWALTPIFRYFLPFYSTLLVTCPSLVPSRAARTVTKSPDKSPDGSHD